MTDSSDATTVGEETVPVESADSASDVGGIESASASYHEFRAVKKHGEEELVGDGDSVSGGFITNIRVVSGDSLGLHKPALGVEITYTDSVEYVCLPWINHTTVRGTAGAFEDLWSVYHSLVSHNTESETLESTDGKNGLSVRDFIGGSISIERGSDIEKRITDVQGLTGSSELASDTDEDIKTKYGDLIAVNGVALPYSIRQSPARVIGEIGDEAAIVTGNCSDEHSVDEERIERDDDRELMSYLRGVYRYGGVKRPLPCTPRIDDSETSSDVLVVDFIDQGTGNVVFSYSFSIPDGSEDSTDGDAVEIETFVETVGGGEVKFIENETVYVIPKAHKNGVEEIKQRDINTLVESEKWIAVSEYSGEWKDTFHADTESTGNTSNTVGGQSVFASNNTRTNTGGDGVFAREGSNVPSQSTSRDDIVFLVLYLITSIIFGFIAAQLIPILFL